MNALVSVNSGDIYADVASFEHAQRIAKLFQASSLVPDHLKKNPSDVIVAFGLARTMGEQPLVVLQNIYFVSGKAAWKTEFMLARAGRAGVFKGPVRWRSEGEGDSLKVTAFVDLAGVEGEARAEVSVDMKMAKAEGWTKNSKYQTMPEHMLRWRSAAMLVRLYAPDVMLGLPILDEIEVAEVPQIRAGDAAKPIKTLDAFASEQNGDAGSPAGTGDVAAQEDTSSPAPATPDDEAADRARVRAIVEMLGVARSQRTINQIKRDAIAFMARLDEAWPEGKDQIIAAIQAAQESLGSSVSANTAGERADGSDTSLAGATAADLSARNLSEVAK